MTEEEKIIEAERLAKLKVIADAEAERIRLDNERIAKLIEDSNKSLTEKIALLETQLANKGNKTPEEFAQDEKDRLEKEKLEKEKNKDKIDVNAELMKTPLYQAMLLDRINLKKSVLVSANDSVTIDMLENITTLEELEMYEKAVIPALTKNIENHIKSLESKGQRIVDLKELDPMAKSKKESEETKGNITKWREAVKNMSNK